MIRISVRTNPRMGFVFYISLFLMRNLRDIEIHDQKGRKNLGLKSFCLFEKISYTKNKALFTINLNFFL
jgi:hypothetical protein